MVARRGFKGDPIAGTCETFPRVSPFDEDSIVNNKKYHKIKLKLKLKFKNDIPGIIDSPSEKMIVSSRTKEKKNSIIDV